VGGAALGGLCGAIDSGFGLFVGTAMPPLLWVTATCFVWRDAPGTPPGGARADDVICPACAYSRTTRPRVAGVGAIG
jgi:hypothetical protein